MFESLRSHSHREALKAVEIYICVILLWYLKDLDEREPSQMFLF